MGIIAQKIRFGNGILCKKRLYGSVKDTIQSVNKSLSYRIRCFVRAMM